MKVLLSILMVVYWLTSPALVLAKHHDVAAPELFLVTMNYKYGFMNASGKLEIPCQYDRANEFSEGLAAVMAAGLWGCVDTKGEMVIRPQFAEVKDFSQGLAAVRVGLYFGFVDKSGKQVIKSKFERVGKFSEGLATVRVDGRWGYINTKGEMIIPARYLRASDFGRGLAAVVAEPPPDANWPAGEGPIGYIDTTGQYVWQPSR